MGNGRFGATLFLVVVMVGDDTMPVVVLFEDEMDDDELPTAVEEEEALVVDVTFLSCFLVEMTSSSNPSPRFASISTSFSAVAL